MGFYREQIVPRITHLTLNAKPIRKLRAKTLLKAKGTVLDVGFGSGLNLPFYPNTVTKVLAIEPSPVARKMASKAISNAGFPVEFAGLDGQKLSIDSESVDCVVTTWTLCTIPDPDAALAEFARVLKIGGMFLFIEHGACPDKNVARWQDRLNGIQMRLAGGCHLNRPVESLIASSPLTITSIDKFYFKGPRTHSYFYAGAAVNAK
jgi:ubiquinone/menaquinone biosynthesis C-methylase UbiE